MDFRLSPEHIGVRDRAWEFAQREILPTIREHDRERVQTRDLLDKLGRGGLLSVGLPRAYGGDGSDYLSLGLACESLERADTSARVVLSVHNGLHCMTLLQWGTDEQKFRRLTPLARGERVGGFGLTESEAGSDAVNIKSTATRDGDHYVLNGGKSWISLAGLADTFLIIARQAWDDKHIALVVDRDLAGFSSESLHGKMGVRAGNTGKLFFENVRVAVEDRLGEEGDGFRVAMSALDHGRYTVAAGAVGIVQACLDASVDYANRREAGGEPIGRKQLVQQMIAEMVAGADVGRLLYYQVGWMKNEGLRHTREVSMAKWRNCAAAFKSASDAIEIHGAAGFSDGYPVERYFRNSRGAMIYEGTHEIHTIMQAEYALGYREDRPLKRTLPSWPVEADLELPKETALA